MRENLFRCVLLLIAVAAALSPCPAADSAVRAWEEDAVIPTYLAGPPDPNPMFYFGRAYQGAEGRVYPYPLFDTLTGKKAGKTYKLVYLENEYVKVGILPEIGGRIFLAVDKTNNYDFFYRQHVIKPALIGMLGAWISGGVEWNIPHHHRATSFLPVQHRIEENPDGSKTIWVGELELRHRMRWAVGCTLRPGRSCLEVDFRVLNTTPLVQSFLCFANVAVHATENYQVIFPPRTQFVTQHSKREFTTWPIATTRYGGSDFTKGVDVSWYRNHVNSNSMFAWNYEDDFVAGYDHGRRAGTLSVADHDIVPGKKLWTWGTGPGGQMWDKALTDDDGPYIEIMVGAYSDNQPDYSWLQPFESKVFKQYWYPFREIGGVKEANLEAAVNLEVKDRTANVGFYTTAAQPSATVLLKAGKQELFREVTSLDPSKPYTKQVALPAGVKEEDLRASLSVGDRELVSYSPVRPAEEPMPRPVAPPPDPKSIKSNEELYLTGLRIDQFHNPALEPDPYWEEALRRDPGDSRVNTAFGISRLKTARFAEAERFLRSAIGRLTTDYTAPKDGEAYYYLGLALKAQDRESEAYDAFYKAVWSAAWQAPGYFGLAELAVRRGDFKLALDFLNRSLAANGVNTRALNLKAAVLRRLERASEALAVAGSARRIDPLNPRSLFEQWRVGETAVLSEFALTMRDFPDNGLEVAVELGNAGLWMDGVAALEKAIEAAPDRSRVSPLAYYFLGDYAEKLGDTGKAADYRRLAAQALPDFVFPFQWEAIQILRRASQANPRDARALYYLGNLLYDWQPAEAAKAWEQARALDGSFPIVHRNLAVAYAREENNLEKAVASLETAVALSDRYPIHLFELDQLYEAAAAPPEKRLAMLEKHHAAVLLRDDALSREVALKVFAGKYDEAVALMKDRYFNVWEGGARFNIHDNWTDAHLLRGHQRFEARRFADALADYQAALEYPPNLQTARSRAGGRYQEVSYWVGTACEALGRTDEARQAWTRSAEEQVRSRGDDVSVMGDAPLLRYYQALSLRKLGQGEKATAVFRDLVSMGERSLQRSGEVDVFSKFGEQQSHRSRMARAHYLTGLGRLGLNESEKAREEFELALKAAPDHLGAKTALARLADASRNP